MKVFLSWSGEGSRIVAEKLRHWLRDVLAALEPWISEIDITPGARWSRVVDRQLREMSFGILCLTPSNISSPWLLFEAGALAQTLDDGGICPYLIGFPSSHLPSGPLTEFQAKRADERGTWDIISTLNSRLGDAAEDVERIRAAFSAKWPELEACIGRVAVSCAPTPTVELTDEQTRNLIQLHEASLAFRVYRVIDGVVTELERDPDSFDKAALCTAISNAVMESRRLCACFDGRSVGNLYRLFEAQYSKDELMKAIDSGIGILRDRAIGPSEKRRRLLEHVYAEQLSLDDKFVQCFQLGRRHGA